ncbi:TetR/AcrR family transcriptional regulator [Sphingomonas sp. CJ20]
MESIPAKPPSKREARKQDRRAAIVAIAYRSFMDHGYANTSMSAISAELGGSKGTLWSYFPSKEELFAAVLDEATVAFREQLAGLLKPSADLRATLCEFAERFITKTTSTDALQLHRLIAAEAGRSPEVATIFYRRVPQRTHELLARFIGEAMDAGQLRRDDPLRVARVLAILCMGGRHQRLLWGQELGGGNAIAEEAAYVTDVFLRAYATDAKPN